MIPNHIKILTVNLARDVGWEKFTLKYPKIAKRPMEEVLMLIDAVPKLNFTELLPALETRKQEVLKPKYRKYQKTVEKELLLIMKKCFEEKL